MNQKEAPKGAGSPLEFTMTHNGMTCGFADAKTMEQFQKAIDEAAQRERGWLHLTGADKNPLKSQQ